MVESIIAVIGTIVASVIGGVVSYANTKSVNEQNKENVELSNSANRANVNSANAAQAAENEKARLYNSESAQVSRLRSAGMSKAGALNSITGSASYMPAAVNVAQEQAAQSQAMDLSPISSLMSSFSNSLFNSSQVKKINAETKRINLENIEKELQNSENVETREKFPALRSYLNSVNWFPSSDEIGLTFDSQQLWKDLEKDNSELYLAASRNEQLRDYVDNFVGYKFEEHMAQIGFSTSFEQAQALRQQYKEYLDPNAVKSRANRRELDNLVSSYELNRMYGKDKMPSSWSEFKSEFRKWFKSIFGSNEGQSLFNAAIEVASWKFRRRYSVNH